MLSPLSVPKARGEACRRVGLDGVFPLQSCWGSLGSDGASPYLLPRFTVGFAVPIITLSICVIVVSNVTPFEVFKMTTYLLIVV
jgi:hypothetical protein